MRISDKPTEQLNEDYIQIVKLAWKFPQAYDLTLHCIIAEFLRRGLTPPQVDDPLEYMKQKY